MCTQPQQRSRGGEYAERELIQRLPGDGKARGSTGTVHASHPQKAPRKAPTSQASWPLAYDPASGRSRAKICPFRCHQLPGGAGKGDEETCVW